MINLLGKFLFVHTILSCSDVSDANLGSNLSFVCLNLFSILEKYYDMNKENCKESLEIYKKFLARTDQVTKFLTVAKASF